MILIDDSLLIGLTTLCMFHGLIALCPRAIEWQTAVPIYSHGFFAVFVLSVLVYRIEYSSADRRRRVFMWYPIRYNFVFEFLFSIGIARLIDIQFFDRSSAAISAYKIILGVVYVLSAHLIDRKLSNGTESQKH